MPFTAAHPAIILPLAKSKKVSLTALVAGCIIPDFEFFLQLREVENIGHHWYGVVLFDLPAGILFCYIFHNLLKHLLIINLPATYRHKFMHTIGFNWNAYAAANKMKVFLSLLMGVLSHVGWDAFTHHDGFFVLAIPFLASNINIAGKTIPLYFMLQVFSSIAGMAILYHALIKTPANTASGFIVKRNTFYWPCFALLFAFIFLCRIFLWPQYNTFWGIVMAGMGGFIYAWVSVSVVFKNIQPKKIYV
jgi:hypothetical protein